LPMARLATSCVTLTFSRTRKKMMNRFLFLEKFGEDCLLFCFLFFFFVFFVLFL
jgi:hypothetical protein